MILPTREQMHRLAPTSEWHEPNYKDEQWKYDPPLVLPWDQLVIKRKKIPSKVLENGLSIMSSQTEVSSAPCNQIAALVEALYEIALVIRIPRHCITTISLADIVGDYAMTKIIIVVEPGAQVTCHDDRRRAYPITASAIEVMVSETAQFHFIDHQIVSHEVHEFRSIIIVADAYSTVVVRSLQEGATYTKTFAIAYLQGSHANVTMHFGARATGRQHHSLITEQHHRAPYTTSHAYVKYVQYEVARTMYDGHIIIEKSGIKSEASQHHTALLINEGARAYARPTLEAKTHDVQCGHGSAIGMLDQEVLWYLQSRGIDPQVAQKIIIDAFFKNFFI